MMSTVGARSHRRGKRSKRRSRSPAWTRSPPRSSSASSCCSASASCQFLAQPRAARALRHGDLRLVRRAVPLTFLNTLQPSSRRSPGPSLIGAPVRPAVPRRSGSSRRSGRSRRRPADRAARRRRGVGGHRRCCRRSRDRAPARTSLRQSGRCSPSCYFFAVEIGAAAWFALDSRRRYRRGPDPPGLGRGRDRPVRRLDPASPASRLGRPGAPARHADSQTVTRLLVLDRDARLPRRVRAAGAGSAGSSTAPRRSSSCATSSRRRPSSTPGRALDGPRR